MKSKLSSQGMMTLILLMVCCQGHLKAFESLFGVTVEAEKKSYLKGEPVALIMTITYFGSKPIDVPHPVYKQGYKELIEITKSGMVDYRRLMTTEEAAAELASRAGNRRLHFEPNSTIKRTNWYHCWPQIGLRLPKGLVFAEVGEYAIRASILWEGATNSAQCTLTTVELTSSTDRQAYDWLEKSGDLCYLVHLCELDPNEYRKQAVRFRGLREKYPDSAFEAFVSRTYMSASNHLARQNGSQFLHLLGDKPKASPLLK